MDKRASKIAEVRQALQGLSLVEAASVLSFIQIDLDAQIEGANYDALREVKFEVTE